MSENSTPVAASQKEARRVVGRVVSAKPNKTITVLVERTERHPLYGKLLRRSTKLHAHDENNECSEGDRVAIIETRPLSKTKHFQLVEILERASTAARAAVGV
jgi:small subunit ribosomal protein S17